MTLPSNLPPSFFPPYNDCGIDKDDAIELAPDDDYEFQTESGIVIYKVKFSDMPKHGFLNIVRKHDGMVMCQMISRCDAKTLEKILSPKNIMEK
tara:strand:+ start:474 stop:755 length:282 start_codon:yes stop_codon:yes gene_type:complete